MKIDGKKIITSKEMIISMGVILPIWPKQMAVVLLEGDTRLTVLEIDHMKDEPGEAVEAAGGTDEP